MMVAWCSEALGALPPGLGEALDGKVVMATGSTGFFGVWTIACFEALRRQGVSCVLRIASRNPRRFAENHSEWSSRAWVEWVEADVGVARLEDIEIGQFDYGLHMAASSDAATNAADPVGMIQSMVSGAGFMARACAHAGAPLLMVSSGAVYGRRTAAMGPAKESDDFMAPPCLDIRQAYGQAKRAAEASIACQPGLSWTVSRPFAFLGPHLPLDAHFAAGNFLRDAARGAPIEIRGDGTPMRSFMNPADLAAWQLWLMCMGPRGEAVNVGSPNAIALSDFASEIASMADSPDPKILGLFSGTSPEAYVPDVSKAASLGLRMAWERAATVRGCLDWLAEHDGSWHAAG